nr:MAG TPA: hypothetical protein [Caudoviricetes sp.]
MASHTKVNDPPIADEVVVVQNIPNSKLLPNGTTYAVL